MGHLPPDDEQRWLLAELGRLVRRCGADAFEHGPIILPVPEAFPDEWTPDLAGVERVTQRILGYVEPDQVHVLMDGRIVASGGKELASQIEAKGYDGLG